MRGFPGSGDSAAGSALYTGVPRCLPGGGGAGETSPGEAERPALGPSSRLSPAPSLPFSLGERRPNPGPAQPCPALPCLPSSFLPFSASFPPWPQFPSSFNWNVDASYSFLLFSSPRYSPSSPLVSFRMYFSLLSPTPFAFLLLSPPPFSLPPPFPHRNLLRSELRGGGGGPISPSPSPAKRPFGLKTTG